MAEAEEESSRKRRRIGSVKSRLGSAVAAVPRSSSSESDRSELDTDLEDAYDGANETVPRTKRVITTSAKKKKGRKSKSLGRGLSEDMMRSLVTLDNYEYEGKKKTESDEEFEAKMRGETQESDVILETVFDEELE